MKRLFRRLALGTAGLALLVGVALVGLVGPVDFRPFDGSPYHRETQGRLEALRQTQQGADGALRAGFGRARLTPTLGAAADRPEAGEFRSLPLAGFGNRHGAPATGVHDELWIKAMALEVDGLRMVVLAADSLIVPREIAEAAIQDLSASEGLTRGQVHFGATHTHSSLGAWGEGLVSEQFAGPFQPAVRTWFAGQLVAAARAALRDLRPASVASGAFNAPEFIRNRLVGEKGSVDPEFVLLALRQEGGAQGVLGTFGAHATVLGSGMMQFSADYPGAWQRNVEAGGIQNALFIAGGVGSHSPNAGAPSFDGTERMGRRLGDKTRDALAPLSYTNRVRLTTLALPVTLPEPHPRVSDGLRLRPFAAASLLPVTGETVLSGFRVGNAVWITTPCDFSGEMARPIKDELQARGFQAAVTSFNGDYIGYVVPAKYYHLDTYETRTMSFFGPAVPDYFDRLIRELGGLLTASSQR